MKMALTEKEDGANSMCKVENFKAGKGKIIIMMGNIYKRR